MIRYIRELRDARIVIEADTSDEIVSLLEKLDVEKTDKVLRDDDWIGWDGGECPVPRGKVVEVKRRDGEKLTRSACRLTWQHVLGERDIVAYRIVGDA